MNHMVDTKYFAACQIDFCAAEAYPAKNQRSYKPPPVSGGWLDQNLSRV